jgi:hypothetical protein
MTQRRWKMMFDRRGDVLRCEFLDGPPLSNGDELIVVEERPAGGRQGGSAPSTAPGSGPSGGIDDGDAESVPSTGVVDADAASKEREPALA